MSLDNLRIDASSADILRITTLSPSVPEVGRVGCSVRILLGLVKPRCTCWDHASTSLTIWICLIKCGHLEEDGAADIQFGKR